MATFKGTSPSGMYADYYLDLNVSSQNENGNTSTLSYKIYLKSVGGGYPHASGQYPMSLYIDGTSVLSKTSSYNVPAGGEFTLATGTFSVPHNTDGTKTISFKSNFDSYHGTCSVSGNFTLPAIARGMTISINSSSADIGNSVGLTFSGGQSGYDYQVYYKITDNSGNEVRENIYEVYSSTTSTSYTIPTALISASLKNTTRKYMTIGVETIRQGDVVRRSEDGLYIYVPSSYVPTLQTFSVYDTNTALSIRLSDLAVQNLSRLQVDITAVGVAGSTIEKYSATIAGTTRESSSSSVLLPGINANGDLTLTAKVTDSRGRTATSSTVVYLHPYKLPSIGSFTVERDSANPSTVNAKVKAIHQVISDGYDDLNPATVTISTRKKGDSTWADKDIRIVKTDPATYDALLGEGFDQHSAYEIRAVITDESNSHTVIASLGTAAMTLVMDAEKNTVGIGKIPDDSLPEGSLDVKGQVRSHDIIRSLSSIKLPGKLTSSDRVNQVVVAGFYTVRSAMGLPDGAGKYGSLIVTKGDLTDAYDSFTDTIQTYLDGSAIYVRNTIDQTSTWTDWIKIGSSGITVSKYSNGYTIKYADGYMEQVVTADLTSTEKDFTSGTAGFYGGKTKVIYFNDSFTSAPEAVANCYSSGYVQGFVGEAYTNRVNVRLYSPNSVTASNLSIAKVIVHAKGFWK